MDVGRALLATGRGVLPPRSSAWRYLAVACLTPALLSFALSIAIEVRLDSINAFQQMDLFFNDDCPFALSEMTDCRHAYNRLRHPNISYFFGTTAHSLGAVAQWLGFDGAVVRRGIALLISPAAGFVTVGCLSAALTRIGLGPWRTAAAAFFAAATFSNSIFSSIPSHFSLSAMSLAVLYLLYACDRSRDRINRPAWIALGVFMTGVTTVNLAVWTFFLGSVLMANSGDRQAPRLLRRVVIQAAVGAGVVIASTFAINTVGSLINFGQPDLLDVNGSDRSDLGYWLHLDPRALLQRTGSFFLRIADAIFPRAVGVVWVKNNEQYPFIFVMLSRGAVGEGVVAYLPMLALSLIVLLGAAGHRRTKIGAETAMLSLVVLAFYGLVYTGFGDDEPFLYSGHWTVSLVYAISGLLFYRPVLLSRIGLMIFSVSFLWTTYASTSAWCTVFRMLGDYAPK